MNSVKMILVGSLCATALAAQRNVKDLGHGKPGTRGTPECSVTAPKIGAPFRITLSNAPPNTTAFVIFGLRRVDLPIWGGRLAPSADLGLRVRTDKTGSVTVVLPVPKDKKLANLQFYVQCLVRDPGVPTGFAFSKALSGKLFWMVKSDFNGDGRSDLAVGVPGEDIGSIQTAGAVNVVYGGGSGYLATPGNQFWRQGAGGILETPEAGDRFGEAVAAGDFNGDGYSDLAIGVPGEDLGSALTAGMVHVLYGSPAGLVEPSTASYLNFGRFWQSRPGVYDASESGDAFGSALATGDFDGDGYDDLAVGIPGEDLGGVANCGAVHVLLGNTSGLTTVDQFWGQNLGSILDTAEPGDAFGSVLASGDFDGDGRADLAIGVPREDIGASAPDAGAVAIMRGATGGLTSANDLFFYQSIASGWSEPGDRFGAALAAGDFNGDGLDDLAIGVPREDIGVGAGSIPDAGAVHVLRGNASSAACLVAWSTQVWHQNRTCYADSPEAGDAFGSALVAADFNGDGLADLAIGVPGEDVGTGSGSVVNAGAVAMLRGIVTGLTCPPATTHELFHQNTGGGGIGFIGGTCQPGDRFGWALGCGDFDGDGLADLAVGVPMEDVPGNPDAGVIHVLGGDASLDLLTFVGDEVWNQGALLGAPEAGDRFGWALSR